jgi:hypothetical protein
VKDISRWIALISAGGFGAGMLGSSDPEMLKQLSSLDIHSLKDLQHMNMGSLNPAFNDMKETIKFIQEQAIPEMKKLMEHRNFH